MPLLYTYDMDALKVSGGMGVVPPVVAQILAARGMDSREMAAFLFPDYAGGLHDPFTLLDMEKAVDRIIAARDGHERKPPVHGRNGLRRQ